MVVVISAMRFCHIRVDVRTYLAFSFMLSLLCRRHSVGCFLFVLLTTSEMLLGFRKIQYVFA